VTRLGSLLRKLSLDELPQLWNVIIGDMSLVGPRPIVDAEIEKYGKCFDLYIKVRPGLTGLWQVSGRNDTTYERRVALDEYYIRNRSLKLDLQILWKTVFVVLREEGAY
jgi:lipopolysaccharide/colanic/teichoic acid biosynthesis glycosyltransferase